MKEELNIPIKCIYQEGDKKKAQYMLKRIKTKLMEPHFYNRLQELIEKARIEINKDDFAHIRNAEIIKKVAKKMKL